MSELQYVVFNLNQEEFGIDIMKVKEVISYEEPAYIPNSPNFIEGVINYRGKVIPVINLKKRFEMKKTDIPADAKVIVISFNNREIGFVVDDVTRTIRLREEAIDSMPDTIETISRRFITGIGRIDDKRLIILLNLHNVLTDDEKAQIEEMEI
ncbi:MAG TPA: purine-binding chemotaxis protein CheW [Tissierellia bacterium]|nr:purine-binding chemotaxis protein CheW [Tissierellia bacterium]